MREVMYFIVPFLLGLIISFAISQFIFFSKRHVDAVMHIDKSDKNKDNYRLVILCPFSELDKKQYLLVKVLED